jgi:hypothetical protein
MLRTLLTATAVAAALGVAGWHALTPPAVIWWRDSVLFVILISLATQIYAALSAAEAADDTAITERLDRIEQHLEEQGRT